MWIYLLILLIILVIYWIYQNSRYHKIDVDQDTYQIEKDSPDKMESLRTLVNIRKKLEQLVNHLLKKYPKNKLVHRLKRRFQDTVLRESNPDGDSGQTSYTVNKGDTIVICLRTNNKQIVDFNTLMYVAIHELSHIYSSSYHHNDEFWRNMKFMINESINLGIYQTTNYAQNPVRYCGMTIASNIPDHIEIEKQVGGADLIMRHVMSHSRVVLGPN